MCAGDAERTSEEKESGKPVSGTLASPESSLKCVRLVNLKLTTLEDCLVQMETDFDWMLEGWMQLSSMFFKIPSCPQEKLRRGGGAEGAVCQAAFLCPHFPCCW